MADERSRRKHDPLGGTALDDQMAGDLDSAVRAGGDPLSFDVRRSMEDQFGADLSGVRVHQDATADRLADQMSARAFTVGSDIFFRQGVYAPDQDAGKHVLAHELTHVVHGHTQSGSGGQAGGMTIGRADAPEEVQAEQTSAKVVKGLKMSAGTKAKTSAAKTSAGTPATSIARLTDCGCGNHTIRRDPTDTVMKPRRQRPRGINMGSPKPMSKSDKRKGVNLGTGFDLAQLQEEEVATDVDTAPELEVEPIEMGEKVGDGTLSTFLESMADGGKNTITHNIPSSGMGRFDAQYLPQAKKLIITVRPRFDFKGSTWTESKKKAFIATFAKQAQQKWSSQYKFECTKPGFESLKANVKVMVAPVTDPMDESAHVNLVIGDTDEGVTGIDRNQENGGSNRNQGNFKAKDAPIRQHDTLSLRCQLAQHDATRIQNFLSEFLPNKDGHGRSIVTTDAKGISETDKVTLSKLAEVLNHGTELKAIPIPILITYFETKGDKGGKKRADAVAKALSKVKKNPIKIKSAQSDVDALKKAKKQANDLYAKNKEDDKGNRLGSRPGGYDDDNKKNEIDKHEGLLDSTNITIGPDLEWVQSYKDSDPYSILAHEFGHMLGNPDEYFGYGPAYLALKKEQLEATGVNSDTIAAKNLKEGNVSDSTAATQENWGKLVTSTGNTLPSMTTKGAGATNSIMNAGAVVMPAHYATLLEALARITAQGKPAIAQGEWKFA